jgi:hypothetical protein
MSAWDNIEWGAYAQPWGKPPDTVPRLLARLAAVGRNGSDEDLRSPLLFAVGNDHAGSYYPIAVPAVWCLPEVLRDGTDAARWQTLDLLTDLLGSFDPDPEAVPLVTEQETLRVALREAAASLRPLVQAMADGTLGGDGVRHAARELLAVL